MNSLSPECSTERLFKRDIIQVTATPESKFEFTPEPTLEVKPEPEFDWKNGARQQRLKRLYETNDAQRMLNENARQQLVNGFTGPSDAEIMVKEQVSTAQVLSQVLLDMIHAKSDSRTYDEVSEVFVPDNSPQPWIDDTIRTIMQDPTPAVTPRRLYAVSNFKYESPNGAQLYLMYYSLVSAFYPGFDVELHLKTRTIELKKDEQTVYEIIVPKRE